MNAPKSPPPETNHLAHDVCVILVEPLESMNIGSVARAMKNLGFRRLRVVAPRGYDRDRARVTACWSEDILDEMMIAQDLPEALADLTYVVGLSARGGKNRLEHLELEPFLTRAAERMGQGEKLGIVFGPEDTGLRNEHTGYCHCLVRLPSDPACPAFNLAQAVLLTLYELRRSCAPFAKRSLHDPRVPQGELGSLDWVINDLMKNSGFERVATPALVPTLIRQLFHRISPSKRELAVLLSFLGRVNRVLKREGEKEGPDEMDKRDVLRALELVLNHGSGKQLK